MATITIEIPAERESLVRRLLALHDELQQLALDAPDGSVLDACENAVLVGGRNLSQQLLSAAVAQRVAAAEKKGRHYAAVPAAGPRKTAGRRTASSSPPSAS